MAGPPWPGMLGVELAIKGLLLEQDGDYEIALESVREAFEGVEIGGAALTLERAAHVYTAERESLDGFPAIELYGGRAQRIGDGQSVQEYRNGVVIAVTHLGDDTEVVTAQMKMHVLALRKLFWERILADVEGPAPIIVGDEDFDPIIRRKEGANAFQVTGTLFIRVPTFS
jgi:hypothetical protein